MKLLKQLSLKEWLSTLIIASAAFLLLGTITALWNNSFFIRMTEVNGWDYIILSFESLLIGCSSVFRHHTVPLKKRE